MKAGRNTPITKDPGPTDGQRKVLRAIRRFITRHGYSPSHADLRDECGLGSRQALSWHLDGLERLGLITREPGVARSIRPAESAAPAASNGKRRRAR